MVDMKLLKLSVVALFLFAVVGCSLFYRDSTYKIGFDFPSENVSKIVKGKTTGDELLELFGGPFAKNEISEDEEVWRYYYSTDNNYKESDIFANEAKSTHQNKTLLIRLKNGTVTNFSYNVGR